MQHRDLKRLERALRNNPPTLFEYLAGWTLVLAACVPGIIALGLLAWMVLR